VPVRPDLPSIVGWLSGGNGTELGVMRLCVGVVRQGRCGKGTVSAGRARDAGDIGEGGGGAKSGGLVDRQHREQSRTLDLACDLCTMATLQTALRAS
jgi:hypothetical protein